MYIPDIDTNILPHIVDGELVPPEGHDDMDSWSESRGGLRSMDSGHVRLPDNVPVLVVLGDAHFMMSLPNGDEVNVNVGGFETLYVFWAVDEQNEIVLVAFDDGMPVIDGEPWVIVTDDTWAENVRGCVLRVFPSKADAMAAFAKHGCAVEDSDVVLEGWNTAMVYRGPRAADHPVVLFDRALRYDERIIARLGLPPADKYVSLMRLPSEPTSTFAQMFPDSSNPGFPDVDQTTLCGFLVVEGGYIILVFRTELSGACRLLASRRLTFSEYKPLMDAAFVSP